MTKPLEGFSIAMIDQDYNEVIPDYRHGLIATPRWSPPPLDIYKFNFDDRMVILHYQTQGQVESSMIPM